MKCALYRVVHVQSGKDYVGISVKPKKRWYEHRRLAKKGQRRQHFHNALAKYGPDAFEWHIVAWCSCFSGAQMLERLARAMGLGHYNKTMGGEGYLRLDPNR